MKKRFAILSALMVCMGIAVSGTVSHVTVSAKARNVITAGSVSIRLNEMSRMENGELVPYEPPEKVMPGQQVSKIVTVSNTGQNPAYVRLLLWCGRSDDAEAPADPLPPWMGLDLNTADWTRRDGAFYYNTPLAPGEQTRPLFTTVTFSEDLGNDCQNSRVQLHITAQATQSENNGDRSWLAGGWPQSVRKEMPEQ